MDKDEFPAGIKYWAQFDLSKKPHYIVYECVGRLFAASTMYMFKERKGPDVFFVKTTEDLNKDGFKPFYLNVEKLRTKL